MRILIFTLFCLLTTPALAAVRATDAWAPPSLAGSRTGIAYVTLESERADALIAASSPAIGIIELHEHTHADGVVKMRKRESIPLPEATPVTLAPRGLHLMLFQLKAPLKDGTSFPLTLRFSDSEPVTLTVVVSQQKLLDFLR